MAASPFETETCGRCGGGGRFSYCHAHGDRCFDCGGSGLRLTKRGAAASLFFRNSLKKAMEEIKVGDLIKIDGKWYPVLRIEKSESYQLIGDTRNYYTNFVTEKCTYALTAGATHDSITDNAEWHAKRAAAVEHQAKLTKTGKLAKKFETK